MKDGVQVLHRIRIFYNDSQNRHTGFFHKKHLHKFFVIGHGPKEAKRAQRLALRGNAAGRVSI